MGYSDSDDDDLPTVDQLAARLRAEQQPNTSRRRTCRSRDQSQRPALEQSHAIPTSRAGDSATETTHSTAAKAALETPKAATRALEPTLTPTPPRYCRPHDVETPSSSARRNRALAEELFPSNSPNAHIQNLTPASSTSSRVSLQHANSEGPTALRLGSGHPLSVMRKPTRNVSETGTIISDSEDERIARDTRLEPFNTTIGRDERDDAEETFDFENLRLE